MRFTRQCVGPGEVCQSAWILRLPIVILGDAKMLCATQVDDIESVPGGMEKHRVRGKGMSCRTLQQGLTDLRVQQPSGEGAVGIT